MPLPPESVQNTVFTGLAGIIIAYLGLRGGKKIIENNDTPKNRADSVFNGYDRIISRLEKQVRDRDAYIVELEDLLREKDIKTKQ